MTFTHLPRVGISLGHPGGVGPEVTARALAGARPEADLRVFGSAPVLADGARRAGVTLPAVDVVEVAHTDAESFQRNSLVALCEAAARGELDAIVTGPVEKRARVIDGVSYAGQTEVCHHFLGADARPPLMVFAGGPFVLGLLTVHVPVSAVAALITPARVTSQVERLVDATFALTGRPRPRVVVLGVNPHAGEGGLLGREEADVVAPALVALQARGVDVGGPVPADGFFADLARGVAPPDAVMAMHHDQGLGPYKLLARGAGVNVTFGLKVPRTSPDHGTALAIAGRGIASSASMEAAIALAIRLAERAIASR